MAQPQRSTSASPSRFLDAFFVLLFWAGILGYNVGLPALRDQFQVQPAIKKAAELEARGGEEIALPILLNQVAASPRNPHLLWALGDIYTKMDRPLLAHFYFQALSHLDVSDLDPEWRSFAQPWQGQDIEYRRDLKRGIDETASLYHQQKIRIPLIYPDAINALLNQPATTLSVPFGYFPPEHPVCMSRAEKGVQCGYAFQFDSGNLWQAISTQKLSIAFGAAGPDCCSLSLDDPDLRSPAVVEREFQERIEARGDQAGSSTEETERERLAFRVRVLTKQEYVLGFLDQASSEKPKQSWAFWTWAALIGWIIALAFLREITDGFLVRRKTARAARKAHATAAAPQPRATVPSAPAQSPATATLPTSSRETSQKIATVIRKAPLWRRICFGLLALILLLAAAGYLLHSVDKIFLPGSVQTIAPEMMIPQSASTVERPGNGINFSLGLSLVLAALLALNYGWRCTHQEPGPVDRFAGRLSGGGYGVRRWRILAAMISLSILAWWANLLFAHTVIHWSAAEAATGFKENADQFAVQVTGDYIYALSPDGTTLHVASFTPATVRAFKLADIPIGAAKQHFELPVPGMLLILIPLAFCAAAALRWKRRKANPNGEADSWAARAFLAIGLLQVYLVVWLSSAQKGVIIFDGIDPDWLFPAFFLAAAQLVLLTSIYSRLRAAMLPRGQRWGWVALYFITSLIMLFWIFAFSDASIRTPGTLWLLTYAGLISMFWWLFMAHSPSQAGNS